MRSILLLVLACGLSVLGCRREAPRSTIAIVSAAEIAPIIALREGFLASFGADTVKYEFVFFSAQGEASLIPTVVDQVAAAEPDLVYVLGTSVAQALQSRLRATPIVQGAATDPVASGLADGWSGSGRNYAATSDAIPPASQLRLIRVLFPQVRSVGVVLNPSESNSTSAVATFREAASKASPSIRVVEAAVSQTADVGAAVASLLTRVDALWIPPDNTVYGALAVVGSAAERAQKPFFATESSALAVGALAVQSADFKSLGYRAGLLAVRILSGEDPATMPIEVDSAPVATISRSRAEALGVPQSALNQSGGKIQDE